METTSAQVRYSIFSDKLNTEDIVNATIYGVELVYQSLGKEHKRDCKEISSCKKSVQSLVDRLNFHHIPPVHFLEIVEDYIDELYTIPNYKTSES